MKTPQLENGHVKIANEVWEALMSFDFSRNEYKIIMCILRKTWGWNKKEDKISFSQISELTKIERRNVIRIVNRLEKMKVLVVKTTTTHINLISFNKLYDEWEEIKSTSGNFITSGNFDPSLVVKTTTKTSGQNYHPQKTIKDTIQKTIHANKLREPSEDVRIYKRRPPEKQSLYDRIIYHYEDILKTQVTTWGKQLNAIKMMLRAGYSEKQIKFAIDYMAADEYWQEKGFDLMTVTNAIPKIKAQFTRKVVSSNV